MIPWLEGAYPVRVVELPGRGRSVVAARALAAGTVVLACSAAATYPLRGRCCASCYAAGVPLRVCASCKAVAYCSQECQRSDWRLHKGECAHQAWLWAPAGEAGREAVGGEADGTTLMLLSRLHRAVTLRRAGDAEAAAAATASGVYTHTLADVASMASRPPSEVPALAAHLERAIDVAGRQGLWIPMGPGAAAAPAAPAALLRTALAFDVNDFSVTDELFVPRAAGVYPLGALLNHSCAPNCCAVYVTGAQAVRALQPALPSQQAVALGEGIAGCARTPAVQVFRTTAPVQEGEELCHSYVDLALPRRTRGEYLRASYGFACRCAVCAGGSSSSAAEPGAARQCPDTDAVLLGRAEEGFFPPRSEAEAEGAAAAAAGQEAPSQAPVERFWADLPKSVLVGIPPTSSHAASAVFNDFTGIPKPLKLQLLTCQELLAAGRMSELGGGKDALSSFPVKLGAEALFRVKRAASGLAGSFPALGTSTALALGREAWALEDALTRLRPLLHPFHVQAHATVSAAFDKYVSLNDIPAAAAACEHLCAFYRAVYSVVCPAHPMLALQLFSLADMYARLGEMAEAEAEVGLPPAGGEPASGEAAGSSSSSSGGAAGNAFSLWRPSVARIAQLQRLFVQTSDELHPSPVGTVPVHSPFPATLASDTPLECARRWRALAAVHHSECARLLTIAYGATHRLTVHAQELAAGRGSGPGH